MKRNKILLLSFLVLIIAGAILFVVQQKSKRQQSKEDALENIKPNNKRIYENFTVLDSVTLIDSP